MRKTYQQPRMKRLPLGMSVQMLDSSTQTMGRRDSDDFTLSSHKRDLGDPDFDDSALW